MNTVFVYFLGFSNLVLAMSTFILLARPDKMLGILAYLSGDIEAWRLGVMLRQDQKRLILLGNKLQLPALVLLFGWSFFCGAAIRFLYAL
jgi:hypothetical protein